MQVIRLDVIDQELSHQEVVHIPAVLVHQLPHAFASGQSQFIAVRPGEVELVSLVEDIVLLQYVEDSLLSREILWSEDMVGQCVDINVGALSFFAEDAGAIGVRMWSEIQRPILRSHCFDNYGRCCFLEYLLFF